MATDRLHWDDLPDTVRTAVAARTGPITEARTVAGGYNSEIAARLDTAHGPVFLKGLRSAHPRSWTQRREAEIAAVTAQIAPRLLWRLETGGWDLLAFAFVQARHADYTVGSADVPLLADTLTELAALPAPPAELKLKRAEDRWAAHIADPDARAELAGENLCHTDFNPENVLITGERAVLADWAWSTRGAPWIDPALAATWLIATGGQTPAAAAQWAARLPAWHTAPSGALQAFAAGNAALWYEIAEENLGAWSASISKGAQRWATYLNRP